MKTFGPANVLQFVWQVIVLFIYLQILYYEIYVNVITYLLHDVESFLRS